MPVKQAFALRARYRLLKVRALCLLAVGKRAAALAVFQRMLQVLPMDRYALASSAHLQMQLKQIDEAIAGLQQLARLPGSDNSCAASWFNLAYALEQAGRLDEAETAFQQALTLDSKLDRAWYGLALVLMQQGRFLQAAEALNHNNALQPLSPHGWYRLAQVWLALGERDKALKVIEHLRTFEPRVAAQLVRENGLAPACAMNRHERQGLENLASGALHTGMRDAVR